MVGIGVQIGCPGRVYGPDVRAGCPGRVSGLCDRVGQVRFGQVRFGQVWLGQVKLGQVRSGLPGPKNKKAKFGHKQFQKRPNPQK